MPPDRGRASKACATCRKQKTRCYAGNTSSAACLRCQTLALQCSFDEQPVEEISHEAANGQSETASRLRMLESTVNRLVDRLEDILPVQNRDVTPNSHVEPSRSSSSKRDTGPPAPMLMIRDMAAEAGQAPIELSPGRNQNDYSTEDIISHGLISYGDALTLIALFQEHYGRWVAFDTDIPSEHLLHTIRQSDLLLCSCCLISVRHTTQEMAAHLAPSLFERAKAQIAVALLTTPQSLEFFQAALILSMWSTSIGQTPLSLDSWLLSGFALQHCLTSHHFDTILGVHSTSKSAHKLYARWSIWNHLCLVHLHYCVGTKRRAMIGQDSIIRCAKILEFDNATNFETRMVAEISLYWCMYESCTVANVDLIKVQNALRMWKSKWEFLLDQPRSQFLQMGFNFAHLLAYERALQSKSAKVKYNLLIEMASLCIAIINLAIDTTDERTKHLSDHIYHLITFAAMTLCRLLNLYEAQIATKRNIAELDALIMNLIAWMHSIGLPCHAGYMFGTIISASHKKLRPEAHLSAISPAVDWSGVWNGMDISQYFPEWLGGEHEAGSNFNLLPDWEPYYQGPPT